MLPSDEGVCTSPTPTLGPTAGKPWPLFIESICTDSLLSCTVPGPLEKLLLHGVADTNTMHTYHWNNSRSNWPGNILGWDKILQLLLESLYIQSAFVFWSHFRLTACMWLDHMTRLVFTYTYTLFLYICTYVWMWWAKKPPRSRIDVVINLTAVSDCVRMKWQLCACLLLALLSQQYLLAARPNSKTPKLRKLKNGREESSRIVTEGKFILSMKEAQAMVRANYS